MAKRKKKTQQKSLQRRPEVWQTVWGILLIGVGLTLVLTVFQPQGALGTRLNTGLGMVFGVGRMLVPFFVIGAGVFFLRRGKQIVWLPLTLYIAMFILLLGLIHLLGGGALTWSGFQMGTGGGLIGLLVAGSVVWVLGTWGAGILLATLVITLMVIVFDVSVSVEPMWQKLRTFLRKPKKQHPHESGQSETSSGSSAKTPPSVVEDEEVDTSSSSSAKQNDTESKDTTSDGESSHSGVADVFPNYNGPSLELLEQSKPSDAPESGNLSERKSTIQSTLQNFGIEVEMGEVHQGPTVTRYLLRPSNGVKLARITTLQNDIALSLAAANIRIEAPVPGYSYAGIEVPNAKRAILRLRDLLESKEYQNDDIELPLALGKNIMNETVVAGLEKMPHLLMGGTTGSGKSMQLHSMILSLLYSNSPEDLRFIFVDPKRVELSMYNDIPHLLTPVIVNEEKAVNSLNWCVQEMERRYQIVSQAGFRDIGGYNEYVKSGRSVQNPEGEETSEPLPYIVVIVDELADLMHSRKKEIESPIVSIAAKARAVGIHLILATQRPSVDVVTGLIKANFPSRIGLKVASNPDSRTILDAPGAEDLLGNGDMLFSGSNLANMQRIQGSYLSEEEMNSVIDAVKQSGAPAYNSAVVESNQPGGGHGLADTEEGSEDARFEEAKEIVVTTQKASASYLQRRLKVGYARAARLLDDLEEAGVVGPDQGSKPREVLINSLEEDV